MTQKKILTNKSIVSGDGYVKFPDGALIQWGEAVALPGDSSGKFTFNQPFKIGVKRIVSATHQWSKESQGYVTVAGGDEKSVDIVITDLASGFKFARTASVIVYGRWK